jgi:hypothetical protein
VDAEVVKEVIADLDLQKLTWGAPSEVTAGSAPYTDTTVMASAEAEPEMPDALCAIGSSPLPRWVRPRPACLPWFAGNAIFIKPRVED